MGPLLQMAVGHKGQVDRLGDINCIRLIFCYNLINLCLLVCTSVVRQEKLVYNHVILKSCASINETIFFNFIFYYS